MYLCLLGFESTEKKAIDYQMYLGIFLDFSSWQVVLNDGLDLQEVAKYKM